MSDSNEAYYSLPVISHLTPTLLQLRTQVEAAYPGNYDYLPFLHENPDQLIASLLKLNALSPLSPHAIISSVEQYSQKNIRAGWQTITWLTSGLPNLLVETSFHHEQLSFAVFAFLSDSLFEYVSSSNGKLSIEHFFDAQIP